MAETPEERLKELFKAIKNNEPEFISDKDKHGAAYAERETLVYEALAVAKRMGYTTGIRAVDDAAWPVVCIVLPGQGEVSWHCPAFEAAFSGYSTAEKYARVDAYTGDTKPA